MSDVVVLYVSDCPNLSVALDRLKQAGADLGSVRLVEVRERRPVPSGFAGSPTVLIDGVNPLGVQDVTGLSCSLRIASVEQLRRALVD